MGRSITCRPSRRAEKWSIANLTCLRWGSFSTRCSPAPGLSGAGVWRNGWGRCCVTIRCRCRETSRACPPTSRYFRRCLEKSPDRRFQSADDVVSDRVGGGRAIGCREDTAGKKTVPMAYRDRGGGCRGDRGAGGQLAAFSRRADVLEWSAFFRGAPRDTLSRDRRHRSAPGLERGGEPDCLRVGCRRQRRHLDLRSVGEQSHQPDRGARGHRQHAGLGAGRYPSRVFLGSRRRRHRYDERARQ